MSFDVRPGDLTDPRVRALLEDHIADMYATSPPASVFTLGLDELADSGIHLVTVWEPGASSADDVVLDCGALRRFAEKGRSAGELKSMRTAEAGRRRGVATLVLQDLETAARAEGIEVLYLETGSEPFFAPARAFYERNGFTACGRVGSYQPDPTSYYMTKELGIA